MHAKLSCQIQSLLVAPTRDLRLAIAVVDVSKKAQAFHPAPPVPHHVEVAQRGTRGLVGTLELLRAQHGFGEIHRRKRGKIEVLDLARQVDGADQDALSDLEVLSIHRRAAVVVQRERLPPRVVGRLKAAVRLEESVLRRFEVTLFGRDRSQILERHTANSRVRGHVENPLEQRSRCPEVTLTLEHGRFRVERFGVRIPQAMENRDGSALARRRQRPIPVASRAEHTRPSAPRGRYGQRVAATRRCLVMREGSIEHAELLQPEPLFNVALRVRHVGC